MRGLIIMGLAIVLAGCATLRNTRPELPASTQEELLVKLASFRFNGRASVRGGSADVVVPSLAWRQREGTSEVRLGGPLGAGSLQLWYGPGNLRVASSHGEEAEGLQAEQFIASHLGFLPPFAALRFWVLGLAAPGQPAEEVATDSTGRIAHMAQFGWRIDFDRWTSVTRPQGQVLVPQRLVATNGELKLTVIVDRWKFGAGN